MKRPTKNWYDDYEVENPLDDTSTEDCGNTTENITLEDTKFQNYETDSSKLSDFMNALVEKLQIVDKKQLGDCQNLLLKYTDEPEFQQLPQSPKLKPRKVSHLSQRLDEQSRNKSIKQITAKKVSASKNSDIIIID